MAQQAFRHPGHSHTPFTHEADWRRSVLHDLLATNPSVETASQILDEAGIEYEANDHTFWVCEDSGGQYPDGEIAMASWRGYGLLAGRLVSEEPALAE